MIGQRISHPAPINEFVVATPGNPGKFSFYFFGGPLVSLRVFPSIGASNPTFTVTGYQMLPNPSSVDFPKALGNATLVEATFATDSIPHGYSQYVLLLVGASESVRMRFSYECMDSLPTRPILRYRPVYTLFVGGYHRLPVLWYETDSMKRPTNLTYVSEPGFPAGLILNVRNGYLVIGRKSSGLDAVKPFDRYIVTATNVLNSTDVYDSNPYNLGIVDRVVGGATPSNLVYDGDNEISLDSNGYLVYAFPTYDGGRIMNYVSSVSLPRVGLYLDSATGLLSGRYTATSDLTFTITGSNAQGFNAVEGTFVNIGTTSAIVTIKANK